MSAFHPLQTLGTCFSNSLMNPVTLTLVAAVLLLPQPVVAAKKPVRLEDVEYLKARQIILSYGWVPVPGNCGGPDVDDHVCSTYPEVGNCTGVGIGFCDMTFRKANRCLRLVTIAGAPQDEPGDTEVREVTFSKGACLKSRRT